MGQSISQKDNSTVITVALGYGQLVPIKVLQWNGIIPLQVCTRQGSVFQLNTAGFYEPVSEDSLRMLDQTQIQQLVNTPWIFPPKPATACKPINTSQISNKLEDLSKYAYKYGWFQNI